MRHRDCLDILDEIKGQASSLALVRNLFFSFTSDQSLSLTTLFGDMKVPSTSASYKYAFDFITDSTFAVTRKKI